MTTLAVVLLVLAGIGIGALRLWASLSSLPESRDALTEVWKARRQFRQYQRLMKRDPAAAHAVATQLEAELQADYDALRERAATVPTAASSFVQRASDDLQGLRALEADLTRAAGTDAAAASRVAELRLQIARVERDLAWARQLSAPER